MFKERLLWKITQIIFYSNLWEWGKILTFYVAERSMQQWNTGFDMHQTYQEINIEPQSEKHCLPTASKKLKLFWYHFDINISLNPPLIYDNSGLEGQLLWNTIKAARQIWWKPTALILGVNTDLIYLVPLFHKVHPDGKNLTLLWNEQLISVRHDQGSTHEHPSC